MIGVAAGRFHTVLWTRDAVYTVGLNGGQLGKLLKNSDLFITYKQTDCLTDLKSLRCSANPLHAISSEHLLHLPLPI